MIERREAPVPLKSRTVIGGETGRWWLERDSDTYRVVDDMVNHGVDGEYVEVLLTNGQTVIVRAKK